MKKVVVITGGTSGIGLELKKLYEKNKAIVVTVSTREIPEDERHYSVSVAEELEVQKVIDAIVNKYGRIDVLINNAGFGMSGITEYVPTRAIKSVVDVNYYGTLYMIRSALKYMQSGSKIINVSSAMALFPVPFRSIYASAKSAVLQLSFALRMELESLGIDVVAICPGDIKTNFTKNRIKDYETSEKYGRRLEVATVKSDSREEKRIPVDVCAKAMYKCINKKKSKPFYIIGGKYKLLYFLTRFTSKGFLLKMTNKLYGGYEKEQTIEQVEDNKAEEIDKVFVLQEEKKVVKKPVEEPVEVVNTEPNTEDLRTKELKKAEKEIKATKLADNKMKKESKSKGKDAK